MTDEEIEELIIQIASSFGISCDDASYIIKSFENFGKDYEMSNIEEDIKILTHLIKTNRHRFASRRVMTIYIEDIRAIEHILSEREQDKARIKELEEELYSANKIINEYLDDIPNQREKEMQARIKELEEEITEHVYWESTPLKQIEQYYIPKQKVKKKISEAKHNRKYANTAYEYTEEDVWDIVKDNLEELLEEGE